MDLPVCERKELPPVVPEEQGWGTRLAGQREGSNWNMVLLQ